MKFFSQLPLAFATFPSGATSTPSQNNVTPALWDGACFYPKADPHFKLNTYPGRWYQVAGTLAPFTAGCKCISANYEINNDGSLYVNNTCQRGNTRTFIEGQATAAPMEYGKVGVLKVKFPVSPPDSCAGPNYIVQEYTGKIAIVQGTNFSNLFILSREQNLKEELLDKWIHRAVELGTPLDKIVKTDQTNCVPL